MRKSKGQSLATAILALTAILIAFTYQNCAPFRTGANSSLQSQGELDMDAFFFSRFNEPNSEVWSYRNGKANLILKGGRVSYSSVQSGQTIYFDGSDPVNGIEPWSYNIATGEAKLVADLEAGTTEGYFQSPILIDGSIYFGARFRKVYKIEQNSPPKLAFEISDKVGGFHSCKIHYQGKLICVAPQANSIFLYNLADGSPVEHVYNGAYSGGTLSSTPVLIGSQLYIIYWMGTNGSLVAFDLNTKQFSDVALAESEVRSLLNYNGQLIASARYHYWLRNNQTGAFSKITPNSVFFDYAPKVIGDKLLAGSYENRNGTWFSSLISINPLTGQYTTLWESGVERIWGIYRSPDAGSLLFVTSTYSDAMTFCDKNRKLYKYDLATKTTTYLTDNVCPITQE